MLELRWGLLKPPPAGLIGGFLPFSRPPPPLATAAAIHFWPPSSLIHPSLFLLPPLLPLSFLLFLFPCRGTRRLPLFFIFVLGIVVRMYIFLIWHVDS